MPNQIECPHCHKKFDADAALSHQLEEKYKLELQEKKDELNDKFVKLKEASDKRERELILKQTELDITVAQKVKEATELKLAEMKTTVGQEYQAEINNLKRSAIENEELKRKLANAEADAELKFQRELNAVLVRETEAIAALLKAAFPFDTIEEVGKGIKGADCIHRVRNKLGAECGTILYESKRTKTFSNEWISKLRKDAGLVKADVLVIITEALPEGVDSITRIDDVWICSFQSFKGLVLVLRNTLIQISEAYSSQTNKGEKMQMLYDYLMGNEFKLQVEAVVDGFMALQDGYNKERSQHERSWKEREKQLEKVLLNVNFLIGSVKGISGASLKQIGESSDVLAIEI